MLLASLLMLHALDLRELFLHPTAPPVVASEALGSYGRVQCSIVYNIT